MRAVVLLACGWGFGAFAQVTCDMPGPCDDFSVCTVNDSCVNGICRGTKISCSDGDPCTSDLCDAQAGCYHAPSVGPCDDGNACTSGDVCANGTCQGAPILCPDDNNVCTTESCTPALGCVHTPNSNPCNDGNACTLADTCAGGLCQGTPKSCDDGNACTADACNPDSNGTCEFSALDAGACTDGNACTLADHCFAGSCVGGGAVTCDDGNVCTTESCAPAAGCTSAFNTAPCDDGNACTVSDRCTMGLCAAGTPRSCDDGNGCTLDECSVDAGACLHLGGWFESSPCDDGNACTLSDACHSGLCTPGAPKSCNDGNACTDDSCVAATGDCVAVNDDTNTCSDANSCTTGDHCTSGSCLGGGATTCPDDSNPCTSPFCAPDAGCGFVFNTASCDDGDGCTVNDRCAAGTCTPGAPRNCDDGQVCSRDFCVRDGDAGICAHAGPDPFSGETWPCDDGNACTIDDFCDFTSACRPGTPRVCNDGNACTDDSCVPSTGGCVTVNDDTNVCSDGNPCTLDRCTSGACGPNGTVSCPDDSNPCTSPFCAPDAGCGFVFNTASCDDGDGCTVNDRCAAGTCMPGAPRNCDDGQVCTRDFCAQDAGYCVHISPDPFSGEIWPCDDGNPCTTGDSCHYSGGCTVSTPRVCDDGNACTVDACNPATGACVSSPSPICEDGGASTDGGADAGEDADGGADAGTGDGGADAGEDADGGAGPDASVDAGAPRDAGSSMDAGARDAGSGPGDMGGCSCNTVDPLALLAFFVAAIASRRRARV